MEKRKVGDTVYRCTGVTWALKTLESGKSDKYGIMPDMLKYEVVRVTNKGFWYKSPWTHKERWTADTSYTTAPTEAEAVASYIMRKRLSVKHCRRRLDKARKAYSESLRLLSPDAREAHEEIPFE